MKLSIKLSLLADSSFGKVDQAEKKG